jgi:hypothetical protein
MPSEHPNGRMQSDAQSAERSPAALDDISIDDVPLDVIVMPSLKRIVAGEVTPEEHARAIKMDQLQRIKRWRHATLEERGRAIADLLDLVSGMDRFPPQQTEFPGFPGSPKRRLVK